MHFDLFYVSRYVGRLFVKNSGKPAEILTKLNEMAGFDADEEIELYEVCFSSYLYVNLVRLKLHLRHFCSIHRNVLIMCSI